MHSNTPLKITIMVVQSAFVGDRHDEESSHDRVSNLSHLTETGSRIWVLTFEIVFMSDLS